MAGTNNPMIRNRMRAALQRLTKGWRSCGIGRNAPMCRTGRFCRPFSLRCPVKIGPTLPARGAADVLRCRPVADVLPVVLPAGQLPAGCPHAPGRSLGKRCRPRGAAGQDRPHALPARGAADVLPWCCRPVLPTCCAAGQLPAGCPTLPAGHSGSVAGPVVLPVKIGPRSRPVADVLPVVLPARAADVLHCRPVADVLPVVLPA